MVAITSKPVKQTHSDVAGVSYHDSGIVSQEWVDMGQSALSRYPLYTTERCHRRKLMENIWSEKKKGKGGGGTLGGIMRVGGWIIGKSVCYIKCLLMCFPLFWLWIFCGMGVKGEVVEKWLKSGALNHFYHDLVWCFTALILATPWECPQPPPTLLSPYAYYLAGCCVWY